MNKINALVYDSGVGGINVLYSLHKLFPYISFSYISDSENAPYGNKSRAQLLSLSVANLKRANIDKFDCVILACNTLSTLTIEALSEKFPTTNFFGIYPNVAVAEKFKTLLLSSKATAESPYIVASKEKYKNLYVKPSQDLILEIEKNIFNLGNLNVEAYLKDVTRDFKYILLGCTHFCFVRDKLQEIFSQSALYDGIEGIVDHFKNFLTQKGIMCEKFVSTHKVSFINSDKSRNFKVFKNLLDINDMMLNKEICRTYNKNF